MPTKYSGLIWIALLLCATALPGCGSGASTTDVAGKITVNQKAPDTLGFTLVFLGPDGKSVSIGVNKDGSFSGPGVSVGENKVGLKFAGGGSGEDIDPTLKRGKKLDPAAVAARAASRMSLPLKIQDPNTSGKTFLVEAGKANNFTWDVTP